MISYSPLPKSKQLKTPSASMEVHGTNKSKKSRLDALKHCCRWLNFEIAGVPIKTRIQIKVSIKALYFKLSQYVIHSVQNSTAINIATVKNCKESSEA